MKQGIILIGVSGSGKSSLAQNLIKEAEFELKEINRDNIRFNLVNPGGDWTTYKFTKLNESIVTETWEKQLQGAMNDNCSVVLSDTNLNIKYLKNNIQILKNNGYNVNIIVMNIPLDICIERDKLRGNFSVGEEIIRSQQEKMDDLLSKRDTWKNIPFTFIVPKENV